MYIIGRFVNLIDIIDKIKGIIYFPYCIISVPLPKKHPVERGQTTIDVFQILRKFHAILFYFWPFLYLFLHLSVYLSICKINVIQWNWRKYAQIAPHDSCKSPGAHFPCPIN